MQNLSKQSSQADSRNLIVISGYYGFDNLGDEAILEELINELKQFVTLDRILVLSNNPKKTAQLYQTKALNRWQILDLLPALSKTKLFISGGGGLFQDATGLGSAIYYGFLILAARLKGAPVMIYAQGLGPLRKALTKRITQTAWKSAQYITVRDQDSFNLARSWGVDAQLTADPVWSLTADALPSKLQIFEGESPPGPVIGISLRRHAILSDGLRKALPELLKKSFPQSSLLVMMPFEKTDDYPVLEELSQACQILGLKTYMLNPDDLNKPSQWLALMPKLDMLIGMRFHALLMALKSGKPVVGLPYDPKVTFLCNTFEQPLLACEQTNGQSIESKWLTTLKGAFEQQNTLAEKARNTGLRMQEMSCKNFQVLARILTP